MPSVGVILLLWWHLGHLGHLGIRLSSTLNQTPLHENESRSSRSISSSQVKDHISILPRIISFFPIFPHIFFLQEAQFVVASIATGEGRISPACDSQLQPKFTLDTQVQCTQGRCSFWVGLIRKSRLPVQIKVPDQWRFYDFSTTVPSMRT